MFWGLLGAFIGVGLALGALAFLIVRICVFIYRLLRGQGCFIFPAGTFFTSFLL